MRHDGRAPLWEDRWFLMGAVMALSLAFLAVAGPPLVPHDPHDISFTPLSPPSVEHWLGVNDGGMDIFSELLHSLRNTAGFGLFSGSAGLMLGVWIGLASAWLGGWLDELFMRLGEILLAVPAVMILVLAAAFFRPSPVVLALILALLAWPTTAKPIRAQALVLKQSLHVQAARQMGASSGYIIFKHLLPELFPLYLISFVAKTRMAMFMEASLAFLGLLDPGRKSLGVMIRFALKYYYLDVWWHWLLPPILCLTLMMMAFTFLAVSLEKVFDPRLREWW
jgi:peptide/nickel transport system permease protein